MSILVRLFLGVVFGIAGSAKLADREFARGTIREFGVPAKLASPLAIFVPVVELIAAVSLLIPRFVRQGALMAFGLLAIFTTGAMVNIVRGHRTACGCFGRRWASPLGVATLVRNAALGLAAAILLRRGSH